MAPPSGSQATILIIRAMALGELRLRDWWRVISRELAAGIALGCLLGVIGFARIVIWQAVAKTYGQYCLQLVVWVQLGTLTVGRLSRAAKHVLTIAHVVVSDRDSVHRRYAHFSLPPSFLAVKNEGGSAGAARLSSPKSSYPTAEVTLAADR